MPDTATNSVSQGPPGSKVELTFKKNTGDNFKSVVTRISPLSILNKSSRPVIELCPA
jgi:hypothetical protein